SPLTDPGPSPAGQGRSASDEAAAQVESLRRRCIDAEFLSQLGRFAAVEPGADQLAEGHAGHPRPVGQSEGVEEHFAIAAACAHAAQTVEERGGARCRAVAIDLGEAMRAVAPELAQLSEHVTDQAFARSWGEDASRS